VDLADEQAGERLGSRAERPQARSRAGQEPGQRPGHQPSQQPGQQRGQECHEGGSGADRLAAGKGDAGARQRASVDLGPARGKPRAERFKHLTQHRIHAVPPDAFVPRGYL